MCSARTRKSRAVRALAAAQRRILCASPQLCWASLRVKTLRLSRSAARDGDRQSRTETRTRGGGRSARTRRNAALGLPPPRGGRESATFSRRRGDPLFFSPKVKTPFLRLGALPAAHCCLSAVQRVVVRVLSRTDWPTVRTDATFGSAQAPPSPPRDKSGECAALRVRTCLSARAARVRMSFGVHGLVLSGRIASAALRVCAIITHTHARTGAVHVRTNAVARVRGRSLRVIVRTADVIRNFDACHRPVQVTADVTQLVAGRACFCVARVHVCVPSIC